MSAGFLRWYFKAISLGVGSSWRAILKSNVLRQEKGCVSSSEGMLMCDFRSMSPSRISSLEGLHHRPCVWLFLPEAILNLLRDSRSSRSHRSRGLKTKECTRCNGIKGALLRKINYKIKASSQRIFKPGFYLVGTSAVWHSESGFENLCWFKWTRHGIFLLYKKVQWVVFRIRRYWDVISKHFPP